MKAGWMKRQMVLGLAMAMAFTAAPAMALYTGGFYDDGFYDDDWYYDYYEGSMAEAGPSGTGFGDADDEYDATQLYDDAGESGLFDV